MSYKVFSGAVWIWPANENYQNHNTFAQFRKDFTLTRLPQKAPLYITADQSYMLYVNGQYVTRGPARGYQTHWPYDEVDVRAYLRSGHNWISILAYNSGICTFQYLHVAGASMLCAANFGKTRIVSDPSWACRFAPGRKRYTGRLSIQQNFQECVDKRENDDKWIKSPSFDRKDWISPLGIKSLGAMPWHSVETRNIPLLTNNLQPYKTIVAKCGGKCDQQWQAAENMFHPIFNEINACKWQPAQGQAKTIEIQPAGKGRFNAVTLDFGEHTVGNMNVEINGAAGGEVLDFYFSEAVDAKNRPLVGPFLDSGCEASLVSRITLDKGKNSHEFYQMFGHRFVTVFARETAKPLKLVLKNRETIYPLEIRGGMKTDDTLVNEIYSLCVRTQRVCMLDAYIDTPWREQAQWWGDARVQAQNTFHISGDTRLVERGIRSLAAQEVPNGLTYGHAPTRAHHCILPDFSLIWIITIWDLYFQTGDAAMYVEQLPRIRRVLNYFATEGRDPKNGLLKYDERYWLFLDWCDIEKTGNPAVYNIWYIYALQKLSELARVSKRPAEAAEFKKLLDAQTKLVIKYFWNEKLGLFRDAIDTKGKPSKRYSVHTQTLAIMTGLKPKAHQNMIDARLLPYLLGKDVKTAKPSSYWVTYVYDVMTAAGYGIAVLEHLKKCWADMVPYKGAWETFVSDDENFLNSWIPGVHSMTHAWAAHPIYHFARTLGGVTQTAPGWKEIRYAPVVEGSQVSELEVTIPTPYGPIVSRREITPEGDVEFSLECPKAIKIKR